MIIFILGVITGAVIGVFFMAMFQINRQLKDNTENYSEKDGENQSGSDTA